MDSDHASETEPEEEPLKHQSEEDPTEKPEDLINREEEAGSSRETHLNDRCATSDVAAVELNIWAWLCTPLTKCLEEPVILDTQSADDLKGNDWIQVQLTT